MAYFISKNYLIFFFLFLIIHPFTLVPQPKKPWTFIVYAAADNNLRDYSSRNIKQMSTIGSNNFVNILVHLDIRLFGQKKTTKRYYVEKNNPISVEIKNEKIPMDSGDPQSLISACRWAIKEYPADHYILVLWNHGTGIIDPYGKRQFDTNMLFSFNPNKNCFELDRSIGFIDLIEALNDPKGICWDDSTGKYLTNQKLEYALNEIVTHQLNGNKFDIIAFDACLMSMLEVAEITKRYAHIQIASAEVEPGPGWKYDEVLLPFTYGNPLSENLAIHIVEAFSKAYSPSGNLPGFADFTQSALNLSLIEELEKNVDNLGHLLDQILKSSEGTILKTLLMLARNKKNLTHFNEPTYVDLHHFYTNLIYHLQQHSFGATSNGQLIIMLAKDGQEIIKKVVLKSVSGSNLPNAQGISVYFPERKIHPSYKKSNFAKNRWANFITTYVLE